MKHFALISVLVFLASCSSVSLPMSGVSSDGVKWSGVITMKEFNIAGGDTICRGKPPMGLAKTQSAEFVCDDGRSGTFIGTRDGFSGGGTGTFSLSDGTEGKFVYGRR